jgi:hypothetical protein
MGMFSQFYVLSFRLDRWFGPVYRVLEFNIDELRRNECPRTFMPE